MSPGISIGTQLHAPHGHGALEKGVTYYFLKSAKNECVYLVDFIVRQAKPIKKKYGDKFRTVNITPTPIPQLVVMQREDFEGALLAGAIARVEKQAFLPPWLCDLEGLNLSQIDTEREHASKSHKDRIDRQIEVIYPLVHDFESVINSDNPDLMINQYARSCNPKQNETRTRLLFYIYILFGRNRFALHFPIHKIGRWCRNNMLSRVKQGRPSKLHGKGYGNNASPELINKAVESYMRERGPGIDMRMIFRKFMTKDLGCREVKCRNGNYKFQHPLGHPILTLGMFCYYIRKEFGLADVQKTLYGRVYSRTNIDVNLGSFTQNVCNISERTERDAYSVEDLPKGLIEGSVLPPLHVTRSRDVASGMILSIGFSQGGERASAYRMELFCRAIDKVKFCALFGKEITRDQWLSYGLPPHDVQDRGAGSTDDALPRSQKFQADIQELAQSHSGQSKAVIESSNPKTRKANDAPSYRASNMPVFELIRREIDRVLKDNETFNIKDRIPPNLLRNMTSLTPLALYSELDRRGRNDSMQIQFDDAVRTLLTKLKARVDRKGVWLHNQCFSSESLRKSKLFGRIRGPQNPEIEVYVLEACVRHIWVDIEGKLLELDIQVPMRVGNEVLYLSLDELKEREKFLRHLNLAHEEHRDAYTAKIEREFSEQTGKTWNSGRTVSGRVKRGSPGAKKEAAESRSAVQGSAAA